MGIVSLAMFSSAAPGETFPAESFFDVFVEDVLGPPYPTGAVRIGVLNSPETGGSMIQTEMVSLSLTGRGPQDTPVTARPRADNRDRSGLQTDSFFDVFFEVDSFPANSFFNIFVEVESHGNGDSDEDRDVDGNDTLLTVGYASGAQQTLLLEFRPGPGLQISDAHFPAESFFDVFVEIDLLGAATFNRNQPVLEVRMTGQYTIPEPATLSLLALGGLALIRRRKRGMSWTTSKPHARGF